MAYVISVIGAGGKTTLVHRLAQQYRDAGKKVLLTTTTHMAPEADTDLSGNAKTIIARLLQDGYCMAGTLDPENARKFTGLSMETWKAVEPYADVIIAEADGSRHLGAKYPGRYEPVIAPDSDEIILVMGLHSIGKIVREEVFRWEEIPADWNIKADDVITFELLKRLVEEGFLCRLRKYWNPDMIHVRYTYFEEGYLNYLTAEEAEEFMKR